MGKGKRIFNVGFAKGFKKAKRIGQRKLRHQKRFYTDRSGYEHARSERLRQAGQST